MATLTSTGGWQTWTTTNENAGVLASGDYVLKLNVIQAPVNINWFNFVKGVGIAEEAIEDGLMLFPNPTRDGFTVRGGRSTATDIYL